MSIVQERQFLLFGEGKQRVEGKVEVEEGGRDEAIDDEREKKRTYKIKFIVLRKMMGETCVQKSILCARVESCN
jgi:hypothetical protein